MQITLAGLTQVFLFFGIVESFSHMTDFIIGFEQNFIRIIESQSTLELCVRVLNIDDDIAFPEGFEVSLAANTIRGTAAGELSQEFGYFRVELHFPSFLHA